MKSEFKKYKVAIVVVSVVATICLIGLVNIDVNVRVGKVGASYREEAISLLEKYRERKIDAEEAGERLYDLSDEVWKEYERSAGATAEELLDLWQDITDVTVPLNYDGYAADYKIDKAIKEIKE